MGNVQLEDLLGRARKSRELESPATQQAVDGEDAGKGEPAVDGVAGGGDQVAGGGDQVAGGGDQAAGGGDQVAGGGDQAAGGGDLAKKKFCWNCKARQGKKCNGCKMVSHLLK